MRVLLVSICCGGACGCIGKAYVDCGVSSIVDRVALGTAGAWITGYIGYFGGCEDSLPRTELLLGTDGSVDSDVYDWTIDSDVPTTPSGFDLVYSLDSWGCDDCVIEVHDDEHYEHYVRFSGSDSSHTTFTVELLSADDTLLASGIIE